MVRASGLTAVGVAAATAGVMLASGASAGWESTRQIDRATYADRVRAMWLGECIANWTGLRTEGKRNAPPFLTDADWGTRPPDFTSGGPIDYYLGWGQPWGADDDTDIEYVYLHLLSQQAPGVPARLDPGVIRAGWIAHINRAIWVSNAAARELMDRGVTPPMTAIAQGLASGMTQSGDRSLMIDAQLTTEFFGALYPGMPGPALDAADGPIRATSAGYAAHASQFFVVLYALAPVAPAELSGRDRGIWLVNEARKYVPGSSKTADIVDFVLTDYLSNPDTNDWERTRDRVYERYQLNASANGFLHRAWFESAVNFATGLIALLYGEGDFKKTVRVGTLSGWDSDNGTATMGGLLGLMMGRQALVDAFAYEFDDRYWAARTRDNLPDYLTGDPAADDTLTLMAQRTIGIVDRAVADSGGRVGASSWLLPPGGAGPGVTPAAALARTPTQREMDRSANRRVAAAGGTVTATITPTPVAFEGPARIIADGREADFRGLETPPDGTPGVDRRQTSTYFASPWPPPANSVQSMQVVYDRDVTVAGVRFVEGDALLSGSAMGGWFQSVTVELSIGSVWTAVSVTPSEPLEPRGFQMIDFALPSPVTARGIRVSGPIGGTWVSAMELDALAPAPGPDAGFDLSGDGRVDAEDVYASLASPRDLDMDGAANAQDARYVRAAVRWTERSDTTAGRR
jgi:hypothetical protein